MQITTGKYSVLFSIKIRHPYFKDAVCPYITVEPDMPTNAILRNKRMIAKDFPGDVRIIASSSDPVNTTKTEVKDALPENQHYTFLLRVRDTAFFSVTKLDLSGFPKQVAYYFNTPKSTKLAVKKCLVTDGILTMAYEEGKTPSGIKILSQNKSEIYSADIHKTALAFVYDMAAHPAGLYTVSSSFAKADQQKPQTQVVYYHPLIKKEPVFGVIDVDTSGISSPEKENTNDFTVQFEPIT